MVLNIKRLILYVSSFFTFVGSVLGQDYLLPNEYQYKTVSGTEVFVVKNERPSLIVGITIPGGCLIQDSVTSGYAVILEKVMFEKLTKTLPIIKGESQTNFEKFYFELTIYPGDLDKVVEAIRKVFQPLETTVSDIEKAITLSKRQYISPSDKVTVKNSLWREYYPKRILLNDTLSASSEMVNTLKKLHKTYICLNHSMISCIGKVEPKTFFNKLQYGLTKDEACNVKPFLKNPVSPPIDIPYSQVVHTDAIHPNPSLVIHKLAPSLHYQQDYIYQAILLENVVRFSKKYRDKLKSAMVCDSIAFVYSKGKYASKLVLRLEGIGNDTTPLSLSSMIDQNYLPPVTNVDIESAKNALQEIQKRMEQDDYWQSAHLSEAWYFKGFSLFHGFWKEIESITPTQLNQYLKQAYKEEKYLWEIKGYVTQPDLAKQFPCTGKDPSNYKFFYTPNTNTFTSSGLDSTFKSLNFFIKINPSVQFAIIGLAADNEYLTIKNDMKDFLDSLHALIITPRSLIDANKIRLDVYRSMAMIKRLVDSGVDQRRLSGGGNIVRKDDRRYPSPSMVYITTKN